MSKKEKFIEEVKRAINKTGNAVEDWFSEDALDFWNGLQISGDNSKPKFTENGKLVLRYMKDNKDTYNNLFKAKDIGEGLCISSRTASGAMRKLVSDGYIEKVGTDPIVYAITSAGIEADLSAEQT